MNRRQFLAALASTTAFARESKTFAAQSIRFDLLISGGRVIDPSVRLDEVRDVAISGGRIAAVEPNISADAAETIDARGKLVVPGLIDIHTHTGQSFEGPGTVLRDGVTGWIDGGSRGADRIAEVVAVARSSPQPGRVLINIGRAGVVPDGDTLDLGRADVAAARDAIARHRDVIVIIDERNRILPEVLAARRRGVWFDVGNGRTGHMRWDTVGGVMKAGFWPDTISTDWNTNSRMTVVVDLPNCMSKLLSFGMTISDAIACATINPARVFPVFNDRGTLNVGAPADVAVLELREGTFEFLDNYKGTVTGRHRLFPSVSVLAGKRVRGA